MLVSELDYELPPQLIAQEMAEPRDASRLMHLERRSGRIQHLALRDLPQLLKPTDLLVFNDTRVLRARLRGNKLESGGQVEALLLREVSTNLWEVLLKPSARLRPGTQLNFTGDGLSTPAVRAEPVERTSSGWLLKFFPQESGHNDIRALLPIIGEVPLPPYIKQAPRDEAQYQTTFARTTSDNSSRPFDSAAAPTAGLHFTPALLQELQKKGIRTAFVTLAVGIGTFRPVQTETLEEHEMHAEEFTVPTATAELIARQRERGARVVAVGTTTTRVLESVADASGRVQPGAGSTSIFIRPGYRFRCVDAMLTNFHLPRSTLLAMISAFAENSSPAMCSNNLENKVSQLTGLEKIRYAYSQAVQEQYRFFSFGDAMLIE